MPNKAGNKKVKTLLWHTSPSIPNCHHHSPPKYIYIYKSTTYVICVSVELSFHIWRQTCGFCQVKDEERSFHPGSGKVFMSISQSKLNLPDLSINKEHTKPFIPLIVTRSLLWTNSKPPPPPPQDTAFTLIAKSFRKKLTFVITVVHHFPPNVLFHCAGAAGKGVTCWVC